MRNTQVAVLSAVILVAALIIAGGNFMLVKSLKESGPRIGSNSSGTGPETTAARKVTIAMMPKSKGNAYFISCKGGAEKAAKELGDVDSTTRTADQTEIGLFWAYDRGGFGPPTGLGTPAPGGHDSDLVLGRAPTPGPGCVPDRRPSRSAGRRRLLRRARRGSALGG